MTFVFIGSEAVIGATKLEEVGQRIELSESDAREIILGAGSDQAFAGATALLPADRFDQLGLTATELQQYGTPGGRSLAPALVAEKFSAALKALHAYRLELELGGEE